jgi:hypothetical protein
VPAPANTTAFDRFYGLLFPDLFQSRNNLGHGFDIEDIQRRPVDCNPAYEVFGFKNDILITHITIPPLL